MLLKHKSFSVDGRRSRPSFKRRSQLSPDSDKPNSSTGRFRNLKNYARIRRRPAIVAKFLQYCASKQLARILPFCIEFWPLLPESVCVKYKKKYFHIILH